MKPSLAHIFPLRFLSFALILTVGSVSADIVKFRSLYTVSTPDWGNSPDMVDGDQFYVDLQYDDSKTDTNGSTSWGSFTDAVVLLQMSRHSANAGAWDPSSGVFAIDPVSSFQTQDQFDRMMIYASGSGFPTIDGEAFGSLDLLLAVSQDIVDTGAGQSLFDQFGGTTPIFPGDETGTNMTITRGDALQVGGVGNAVSLIPEPASLALLAASCMLAILRR